MKRTEASIAEILPWIEEVLGEAPVRGLLTTVETEIKYGGYIQQQERQMERMKDCGAASDSCGFRLPGIPGLSREVQDKLERVRPATLGQAGRIPGVTPAAVAVLDCYLSLSRGNDRSVSRETSGFRSHVKQPILFHVKQHASLNA